MNYNKLTYDKYVELEDMPNINALDGWESPITIATQNIIKAMTEFNKTMDNKTMEAIVKVGIDVNKDELIRAMQYDRDQYSKGYTNGYNAGYNADKWISVEDRMPDEDCKCLVFTKDGITNIDYYYNRENAFGFRSWKVTHWMPLPEPPKEVTEDD